MAKVAQTLKSSGPAKRGVYRLFRDSRNPNQHEMWALCTDDTSPFTLTERWARMALNRDEDDVNKCRIIGIRTSNGDFIQRHGLLGSYHIRPDTQFTVDWSEL